MSKSQVNVHLYQCLCGEGTHELTCIEENLSALVMLPCTGHMKRRPVVAVMSLHKSTLIDHELDTVRVTCGRPQTEW